MALIENAQVVSWANNRARPLADKLTGALNAVLAYQADYAAQGVGAAITGDPAGATSQIDDGSVAGGANAPGGKADGRAPITGTTLQNWIACLNQLQVAWNTTNVTGVGTPPTTTQNQLQVNGSNR